MQGSTQETITCLVGDDHEALRKGVMTLLEMERDIRVVGQAANGPEALSLTERRRPDVLVVDVRMPEMDGIELCRQVLARDLPTAVVVYTAFDELEALEMALDAGASGYVLKTGTPQELLRAVRVVCEGQRYIDPILSSRLLGRRASGSPLSGRETEVLQLLADGLTTEATGRQLFLSPATVRSYAENAMHKLEARNRVEAVAKALRLGLVS